MTIKSNHTFVILAYKNSQYLISCIQSLINQSVKSEIIISTSTPSSFIDSLADKYSLPVFINNKRDGIASDWSFAYKICKTKYVTLAHQDDIYSVDFCKKSIEAMDEKNGLISFTDYYELYNDKKRSNTLNLIIKRMILLPFFIIKKPLYPKSLKRFMLSFGSPICCPGVMYNKEKIGNIDFNPELTINMDWGMWFDLAEKEGAFSFVPERLMGHRIHSESATTDGLAGNRRQFEDIEMFKRVWPDTIVRLISKLYSLGYLSNN